MIKKKDLKIIIILLIVTVIISSILIFNIVITLKYREGNPKNISYINKINDNLDYQVFLKSNNYIDEKYLDTNYSYITSLVKYIKSNFMYEYNMDNGNKVNYTYQVVADIIVEYGEETEVFKPLWKKRDVLLEPKSNQTALPLKINESLNVSISYYNQVIKDFTESFSMPIKATLEIKMIININGDTNQGESFSKEHTMTLSLPLGVKAFDIIPSKDFVNEEIVYKGKQPKAEENYMKAIIYIVILVIVIGGIAYLIKLIIDRNISKYILEKKRILKEYGDRIVTVSSFIKYDDWEVVDVASFDELIDLSNEAFEPIFFWERKYNHNKEAWFAILRDKVVYLYTLYRNK